MSGSNFKSGAESVFHQKPPIITASFKHYSALLIFMEKM
jgi:hypothetical protein